MKRCFKVVQREFNRKFNTNLDLKTDSPPAANKDYESNITEMETVRPPILTPAKANREGGLGNPLNKEPENVQVEVDEIEPPPEAPMVTRWSRRAHPNDCHCGCEAPAATGKQQRRRKKALLCRPVPEVCGAIGVHTEELLSETSDALPNAMGG